MFDLIAFIRQLLPGNRRTSLNVAFIHVLFSPVAFILKSLEEKRLKQILSARATGQVLILEDLLNRAAFGTGVGPIYVLDGDYIAYDFRVMIPSSLSVTAKSALIGVLETYSQAGKRYTFQTGLDLGPTNVTPAKWAPGYPILGTNALTWAIDKTGIYYTIVKKDGETIMEGNFNYLPNIPKESVAMGGTVYTVQVAGLTATLNRDASGAIARVGFVRSGVQLHILAQTTSGNVEIKLEGVDGTTYSDTYQAAQIWDASDTSGQTYNRRRYYPEIPAGKYKAYARVEGQTTFTTIDLNFAQANQPPVVANPIAGKSAQVGQSFNSQIPLSTFSDPDGSIASIAISGLPAGLSYNSGDRIISGTPTTAGSYTVTATGADNQGATTSTTFTITVATAGGTTPDPGTPPVTGGTQMAIMNPWIGNWGVQWSNGKARVTASPDIPAGRNSYYFIAGQPPVTSLPTSYDFSPGDQLQIFLAVATSMHCWESDWDRKSSLQIVFGQPT